MLLCLLLLGLFVYYQACERKSPKSFPPGPAALTKSMHTPAHAPARPTASSAQSDPSAGVPLLDPNVRLLSPSDPLWPMVLLFLAVLGIAENVLPFPETNFALYDMCCAVTSLLNVSVSIPLSCKMVFVRYSRRFRTKHSANKTGADVQAEFHEDLHDDSMRFVLRWVNALMIAESIFLIIHWNSLFFAHHIICLTGGLPALLLGRGGTFPIAATFAGEVTNPLAQFWFTLRSLPLILTDPALIAYLATVEKQFALPLFLVAFVLFRVFFFIPIYLDYLLFYLRRLCSLLPSSQHRKTANDKRAADEHASEHADMSKASEPPIPLLVLTVYMIAAVLILSGSANFILENWEYLVLPDPSALSPPKPSHLE